MTSRRTPTRLSRQMLGVLLAAAALAVACEAPRPEPVAPINELAARPTPTPAIQEVRVAPQTTEELLAYLRLVHPKVLAEHDPSRPTMVVSDQDGRILSASRAPSSLDRVAPDDIESIEVIKGRTLPAEFGAGLIKVRLKGPSTIGRAITIDGIRLDASATAQADSGLGEIRELPLKVDGRRAIGREGRAGLPANIYLRKVGPKSWEYIEPKKSAPPASTAKPPHDPGV